MCESAVIWQDRISCDHIHIGCPQSSITRTNDSFALPANHLLHRVDRFMGTKSTRDHLFDSRLRLLFTQQSRSSKADEFNWGFSEPWNKKLLV